MTGVFLRASIRIYSGILLLYPFELRRSYGDQMADLFAEDLTDAWLNRRALDVARIWWHAAAEALPIALPLRAANPALVGPLASLLLHAAVIAGIVVIATVFREGVPHAILHGLVSLNLRPE